MVIQFQSSFELTGYITLPEGDYDVKVISVSKLFRAYGLYNKMRKLNMNIFFSFKALSSLRVI